MKGHTHLIQAWKILADRHIEAKLLLIGEGSLKEALHAQVRDGGLEHLVEFRGFQQRHREGPGSLLVRCPCQQAGRPSGRRDRSRRAGLPTLVTDVPGSRDCVPPGASLPNLVPFGDASALADALSVWLGQPDAVADEGQLVFRFSPSAQLHASHRHKYTPICIGNCLK